MPTPKRRVAAIPRAPVDSEPSEARTVGGSVETDAKAVTVIPHGLPSTEQVTTTTPAASALIAWVNSRAEASSGVGSVMSFRGRVMAPLPREAAGGQTP